MEQQQPPKRRRRILFIDAFDSFTNNIIGLLEQALDVSVTEVHINDELFAAEAEAGAAGDFAGLFRAFDAVVVGPGPGHPAEPADVGFIGRLWDLADEALLPMLGVCLGFQSLCHRFGADVKALARARHGVVSSPTHYGADIFDGVGLLETTQYHSLHVGLKGKKGAVYWEPSPACPELLPLAWDLDDRTNGPVLMAARHVRKPFWGVQFHPESICTSDAGRELVVNWWREAMAWSDRTGRVVAVDKVPQAVPLRVGDYNRGVVRDDEQPDTIGCMLPQELRSMLGSDDLSLSWDAVPGDISPVDIVQRLSLRSEELILLDSQGHARGRYSILGIVKAGETMKVTYRVSDHTLRYGFNAAQLQKQTVQVGSIENVWPILQEALDIHDLNGRGTTQKNTESQLPDGSPFWGGFMGYISYEAGLETIDVALHHSCHRGGVPDINFAFIHRSIIVDHVGGRIYVQSLLPEDWVWIRATIKQMASLADKTPPQDLAENEAALATMMRNVIVDKPVEWSYRNKVFKCQRSLASGDSYELCLTAETEINVPRGNDLEPWTMYKELRRKNAAPFGAYINLGGVTVVGSSPERFLSWTREGRCQFRPIKGTVKKGPKMSREKAHKILGSSKERAENLMIVDLIRHDLCGVVGADNSWVSKLMVVEEYETVYQLVSVIEGQLPAPPPPSPPPSDTNGKGKDDKEEEEKEDKEEEGGSKKKRRKMKGGARGMDVLRASLPPGSMTGAPKKRSCQLLRETEERPRGVYSGVLGYMEIGGGGDFSVVIRTAVRNTDKLPPTAKEEIWRVGAGGAVTIQSNDYAELAEMQAKLSSVLAALVPNGA